MWEPLLIATETVVSHEFGIHNAKIDRWVIVDSARVLRFSPEVRSLAHGFPENPEAGTRDFVSRLLDWITSGCPEDNRDWSGLKMGFSQDGARNCAMVKCRVDRPVFVDSKMEIEHLKSREIMFEVRGPNRVVENWEREYLEQHPVPRFETSITTVDYGRGYRTLRVWRRRNAVDAFA